MKKIYLIIFLLMFVTSVVNAADRYSVASSTWNNTATWSATSGGAGGATVPVAGDNVFIEGGFTVTISSNVACTNLTVGTATAGTLTIGDNNNNRSVTVSGDITIASTGIFQSAGNGDNTLLIGGNLANAGTFNMNDGTAPGADADVTFNGATNQTVSGAGATTDFNFITIANTGIAGSNIVEISSTNFTVPAGFMTLTSGIFKLSGSFSITNTFFPGTPTINSDEGFWLNNTNATVTAQNNTTTLNGSLRITAGTYNVGTTNNSCTWGNNAVFTMEGGAFNVAARLAPSSATSTNSITFTMSGGTLTTSMGSLNPPNASATIASFDIPATGTSSSFTMSGGTIIIQKVSAGVDYRMSAAGTVSITGGTVQFGNASTSGSPAFDVGATAGATNVFPSLSVNATGTPTVTFNTAATIRGNVTIATGTTLNANSLAVSVLGNAAAAGDWTNNGTFTSGTQVMTFNGSSAQSITGGGGSSSNFSSLVINNAAGVSLGQDVNVSGTMTFTSGVVTSSVANTLTINDGASVTGASNASYVDGPMIKLGDDDFTFPVGDPLGSYHPIRLNNTAAANPSAANSDSYNAEFFRASSLTKGPIASGAGLFGVSNCEHWGLNRTSGIGTPDVEVSWTANSPCGGTSYVTQLTGLVLAWLDLSNEWQQAAGSGITNNGTATAGTSMQTDVSQFGFFALGNTAPNANPLPVKFSNIKVYQKANGVQIDWTAFTEINVDKYVIERSADGQVFSAIGEVTALNLPSESRYGYFDANPLAGVSFYRLRNIDNDGRPGYSNVVRVDLSGKGGNLITVYPNPVRSGAYISYSSANLAKGNYTASIFNTAGQPVFVQTFSHSGGAINQTIQLPATVRSGLHTLQLDKEGAKVTGKTFMVQ